MNTIIKFFNNLILNIINLIYPLKCAICSLKVSPKDNAQICKPCLGKFKINPNPNFSNPCKAFSSSGSNSNYKNNKITPIRNMHGELLNEISNNRISRHYDKAWAKYIYEGELKNIIYLFKYRHRLSLLKQLGKLLFNFAEQNLDLNSFDYIMYVPMHRRKLRQRKFNQAKILAAFLAKKTEIPLIANYLKKSKYTRPQVELSGEQRLSNVKGSFKLKNKNVKFNNKAILLVDDIFTTGATVKECSKLLKGAGAKRIEVLVLARTQFYENN